MSTFVRYAIEANFVLLFFLLVESFLLKNEKLFSVRRFFLLGGILLAMTTPVLKQLIIWPIDDLKFSVTLPVITVGQDVEHEYSSTYKLIEYFYFVGVAVFSINLLKQLAQLFKAMSKPHQQWNELRVYESKDQHHVFSFFWFVSMDNSKQFNAWEREKILQHELVHAQRWHSLDILLISFVQILFWFNPLLYFYKKKLIQLHEFEADARSVESEEIDKYCSLLAKVALQSTGFTLANHFVQPFTINRILMMKSTSKKMHPWKMIVTASCTSFFLGAMCFYEPATAQDNKKDEVQTQVDEVPMPSSGYDELAKALDKELKYPPDARKNRLQGKTLLQFVVEKDGTLSKVTIKKGFDKACDNEALRAVKALTEKWIPGKKSGKAVRTQMVLPIQFKL